MIFHPKIGQKVRCHYARPMPTEGLKGTVAAVAKGPGPRNVCIRIDDPDYNLVFFEIIPRGNLIPNENTNKICSR